MHLFMHNFRIPIFQQPIDIGEHSLPLVPLFVHLIEGGEFLSSMSDLVIYFPHEFPAFGPVIQRFPFLYSSTYPLQRMTLIASTIPIAIISQFQDIE